MKYSNPARRLHTILTAGNAIDRSKGCKASWGIILGVQPSSPELLRKLAKVMMLPEQIMELVAREFPARLSIQAHWEVPVRKAFESQNLSASWNTFDDHIVDTVVDFLAMTSDLIEEKTNSDDIADDDLSSIKTRFMNLSTEILQSDLSPRIKAMIARMIAKIISAIDDYKISGSADILSAIDMAIGRAAYDAEYRNVLANTPEGTSFRETMGAAADIMTVAQGMPQIASGIMALLSGSN